MEGEYMSRTCKLASLFLALAMLLSFGSAFAQEAEVETEAPAVSAPVEETAAPAEQPATEAPATETPATEAPATETPATEAPATETPATEAPATETPATEAPATEAPAHTAVPEKNMVNVGYAQAEGAVFVYTEPVISDATRIGQFTATSYFYVLDRYGSGEEDWLKIAFAYAEGDSVAILEGYIRVFQAQQVSADQGAGPYLFENIGLSLASFENSGMLPVSIVDPETGVAPDPAQPAYYVAEDGSVIRTSTGEAVSTVTRQIVTSGPALNFRSVATGTVAGSLASGEKVQVISQGDKWTYVLINGGIYTVMSAYVQEVTAAPEQPAMTEEDFAALVDKVEINFCYSGETLSYGDQVTLAASIPQELADANIQWQVKVPGGDWQDVEGAYGATYTLTVSEENVDNLWRVRLTLG